jgi:hypothetical protein
MNNLAERVMRFCTAIASTSLGVCCICGCARSAHAAGMRRKDARIHSPDSTAARDGHRC